MKRESRLVRLLLVFLSCLWLAACGNVQVKADQPIGTATLKPTVEDKRAGLVGIAPGFAPKTYRRISVGPFGVTEKDISGDDDKQFAQVMPVYLQAQLVEQLRAAGLFEQVTTPEDGATVAEGGKALKLLGTITELSGGSRGLRFWIGFGAGRSKVQIETRLGRRRIRRRVAGDSGSSDWRDVRGDVARLRWQQSGPARADPR